MDFYPPKLDFGDPDKMDSYSNPNSSHPPYPHHHHPERTLNSSYYNHLPRIMFDCGEELLRRHRRWIESSDRIELYCAAFFVITLLIIVGIPSNALQFHGVVAFPRLRRRVELVFAANMALVGLFYLVLNGLIALILNGVRASWPWHQMLFSIDIFYVEIFFRVVNTTVMAQMASMVTALAFDSYLVEVHPDVARAWRTPKIAVKACLGSWIVGILLAIGDGVVIAVQYFHRDIHVIYAVQDSLLCFFFFLIPILATLCFRIVTHRVIRGTRTESQDDAEEDSARNALRFTRLNEEELAANNTNDSEPCTNSTAMTMSFVACWAFYHGVNVTLAVVSAIMRSYFSVYATYTADILVRCADLAVAFYCALNPMLYAMCNSMFRQHQYRVARNVIRCERQQHDLPMPLNEVAEI